MDVQQYWVDKYRNMDALWLHDGNNAKPHVELTSGLHSNGFFNSEKVMENPQVLDEACDFLSNILKLTDKFFANEVDRIVGPAMGAITLAHDMARHISKDKSLPCLRGYVEKKDDSPGAAMLFKRVSIRTGERILLIEDVITTGTSVEEAAKAVLAAKGRVHPFILCLVNRSGLDEVAGKKIIALINAPIDTWAPEQCPLCQQGSEALAKPKLAENWARLKA